MAGFAQVTTSEDQFVLTDLVLTSSDVQQVQGQRVANGSAFLSSAAPGAWDTPTHYVIGANRARLLVNALIAGRQIALRASNTSELTGEFDPTTGIFTMEGRIEDGSSLTVVQASLLLAFRNRPPVPRISAPAMAECTSPGLALVRVSATGSTDPDGPADIAQYLWIVDRGTPHESVLSGAEVELSLPLGAHDLQLFVRDQFGSLTGTRTTIEARDTAGPVLEELTLTPSCLWPPSHDLAHYRIGRDVQFIARDVCSPGAERVQVVRISSNEAEDGVGDGHTGPDHVITDDGFCLRAERSGLSQGGRQYLVEFEAVDRNGNRSLTPVTIAAGVAHDQRGASCDSSGAVLVSDGDPACRAKSPVHTESPLPAQAAPLASGCAGVPSTSALAMLLVLPLARRRRS